MAAPITTSATSLEGQLQEVLIALQNVERNSDLNPNGSNFIAGSYNTDTMIFSGTFSLPVKADLAGFEGRINYVADPYTLDPSTTEAEAPAA